MNRLEIVRKFQSVHPQIKQIYKIRLLYSVVSILPMLSALYESGHGSSYYAGYLLCATIWPNLAFLLSCSSKEPKRTESILNHNLDMLVVGIWVPIVQFNPMILILVFIIAGMSGIITTQIIFYRFVSIFVTIGIGVALFGFHIDPAPTLLTTICTGISIVIFSYATSFVVYQTTKKISSTRKILKIQKKKLEESLSERNKAYKKLNDELRIAESYIRNMLPLPIGKGCIQTDWIFAPTATLGGDAFGYYWLDAAHFAFYLLDVSGHGVGAALLSVSVLNDLRSQTLKHVDFKHPHQVLRVLNTAFQSEKHDDMFFTIWYGVFNKQNRTLNYASAGHPPAILIGDKKSQKSETMLLKTPNSVIGGFPGTIFNDNSLQIRNGSALYLFSDGVYEVDKIDGTIWRFNEFQEYLQGIIPENGSRLDQLFTHVKSLSGSESLNDDFSIIELVFD